MAYYLAETTWTAQFVCCCSRCAAQNGLNETAKGTLLMQHPNHGEPWDEAGAHHEIATEGYVDPQASLHAGEVGGSDAGAGAGRDAGVGTGAGTGVSIGTDVVVAEVAGAPDTCTLQSPSPRASRPVRSTRSQRRRDRAKARAAQRGAERAAVEQERAGWVKQAQDNAAELAEARNTIDLLRRPAEDARILLASLGFTNQAAVPGASSSAPPLSRTCPRGRSPCTTHAIQRYSPDHHDIHGTTPAPQARRALVERFDTEPYSDFSAKMSKL